jgi:hypothetical protein
MLGEPCAYTSVIVTVGCCRKPPELVKCSSSISPVANPCCLTLPSTSTSCDSLVVRPFSSLVMDPIEECLFRSPRLPLRIKEREYGFSKDGSLLPAELYLPLTLVQSAFIAGRLAATMAHWTSNDATMIIFPTSIEAAVCIEDTDIRTGRRRIATVTEIMPKARTEMTVTLRRKFIRSDRTEGIGRQMI